MVIVMRNGKLKNLRSRYELIIFVARWKRVSLGEMMRLLHFNFGLISFGLCKYYYIDIML